MDQDTGHGSILKSIWEKYKDKKGIITDSILLQCLIFAQGLRNKVAVNPPPTPATQCCWCCQGNKLGTEGFENQRPGDRYRARTNNFGPFHFP